MPTANRANPPGACVVDLTYDNMVQHEARCGGPVVFYRTSVIENPMMRAEAGFFMMGGVVNPSSAVRPKTCGLALAMVAVFCYFPGISMVVSIGRVGITNKTVIGMVFTSVALTLTLISSILCIRSRYLARKIKQPDGLVPQSTPCSKHPSFAATEQSNVSKALLSNRDDCCVEKKTHLYLMPNDILCECDEIELANRIAQSFSLSRYFANLDAATGPFDLDHEAMDRATEYCIREDPRALRESRFTKRPLQKENSSSVDSAIDVEYDASSLLEGIIVV